ncbi:MAG: P-II family nitrogen regulator [Firmicutes bacterium]|nr:P-II family nitrogen regulator [Bacillota bacterium]
MRLRKIEAYIREERLDNVRSALEQAGFTGMSVVEAKGRGDQKGLALPGRKGAFRIEFLPKILVILVVKDEDYPRAIEAIIQASNSGRPGDGKIFVSTVDEVIRIRTGKVGAEAL